MKFFIKDFFSKCDQIRSLLRIWSHLLKKFLLKNFIFCAVLPLNLVWVYTSCSFLNINSCAPFHRSNPYGICLFKVNNRITRAICEICLKLTIKTPGWRHLHRSVVFIVNLKQISHIVLVFLLLILNKEMLAGNWVWL